MRYRPNYYDGLWWVTVQDGGLTMRLFATGKVREACIDECRRMNRILWEQSDPVEALGLQIATKAAILIGSEAEPEEPTGKDDDDDK